jgi:hypothetical protein
MLGLGDQNPVGLMRVGRVLDPVVGGEGLQDHGGS